MKKQQKKEIAKLATPIKDILASKGLSAKLMELFKEEIEGEGVWDYDSVTIRDLLSTFIVDDYSLARLITEGFDCVFYELTYTTNFVEVLVEVCKECPITMNKFLETQGDLVAFMMKKGCGLISDEEAKKYHIDLSYLYEDDMELLERYAYGCPSYLKKKVA